MTTSLPRAVGYLSVAAMLPYLGLKTSWILGSDLGLAQPGLMRSPTFVVGNLLTAMMEIVAAGLVLALVLPWGRRLPVWTVLLPMWVAGGLLAPVMLAAPLGFLAKLLTGTAGSNAGEPAIEGLHGWVYFVVYSGFILQGTGLAVAFALHVRDRWRSILTVRLHPGAPPGPTRDVQLLATVAVGVLTAVVVVVRVYWAGGGQAGLPAIDRDLPQQALDASTAALGVVGLIGLIGLVSGRPGNLRTWVPLTAAWVGAGSMFCSGVYQLVILLAPTTSFASAGGGGFGLALVAQTFAGLLAATTGAFYLVLQGSPREPGPAGGVGPDGVGSEVRAQQRGQRGVTTAA